MKRIFLTLAGAALLSISANAQTSIATPAIPMPPPPPGAGPQDTVLFYAPMGRIETFHNDMKPVVNAPYQATIVTESTEHLADGNVIQNSHTSKVARDSHGRTRTEETIDKIGPWSSSSGQQIIIFISDPVAKTSYVLHPDQKTAEKLPSMAVARTIAGEAGAKTMSLSAAAGCKNCQYPDLGEVGANTMAVNSGGGMAGAITIQRAEVAGTPDSKDNRTVEDLGAQQINGVTATGKRVTITIPANTMGNQLPIVSTNETWYSPDLKTVVESKRDDPRFGENTFSLTNIQKGEPPADLFQVPSDYTITSEPPKPVNQ